MDEAEDGQQNNHYQCSIDQIFTQLPVHTRNLAADSPFSSPESCHNQTDSEKIRAPNGLNRRRPGWLRCFSAKKLSRGLPLLLTAPKRRNSSSSERSAFPWRERPRCGLSATQPRLVHFGAAGRALREQVAWVGLAALLESAAPMASDSRSEFYPNLEATRGIAALMVALFHIGLTPYVDVTGHQQRLIGLAGRGDFSFIETTARILGNGP